MWTELGLLREEMDSPDLNKGVTCGHAESRGDRCLK